MIYFDLTTAISVFVNNALVLRNVNLLSTLVIIIYFIVLFMFCCVLFDVSDLAKTFRK